MALPPQEKPDQTAHEHRAEATLILLPTSDRRAATRRPCLVRLMILWRGDVIKCFVTDASHVGLFIRTHVLPPTGTDVTVLFPDGGPSSDCVRLTGKVMRRVKPGDPAQPLGGVGIRLHRLTSPRGGRPAQRALKSLYGTLATFSQQTDVNQISITFPDFEPLRPPTQTPPTQTPPAMPPAPPARRPEEVVEIAIGSPGSAPETEIDLPRAVVADFKVFVRLNNLVLRGNLRRLSQSQAIVTGITVRPDIGDPVKVRLLATGDPRFGGVQFSGIVDQIDPSQVASLAVISIALSPDSDAGSLKLFIRSLSEGQPQ
ncbi:MAG: hypothetical protein ACI9OJ_002153 [Myxococcota bacterium]|jgi:hypothetical protein